MINGEGIRVVTLIVLLTTRVGSGLFLTMNRVIHCHHYTRCQCDVLLSLPRISVLRV